MFNTKERERKIVQQIHDDFDAAQDRLLYSAEELLASLNILPESNIEKVASRLANIGFTKAPIVKKSEELRANRLDIEQKRKITKELADNVIYYKQAYPFLKFLTEEELEKICAKYNLIHAPVTNYIKDVPEKNLKEIENAQALKNEDGMSWRQFSEQKAEQERIERQNYKRPVFSDKDDYLRALSSPNGVCVRNSIYEEYMQSESRINSFWSRRNRDNHKEGLFIAAPKSHFDLEGLESKGKFGFFNKPEPPDPIVFRYVRGGIQVLSKWGLEASDELLLNPLNN